MSTAEVEVVKQAAGASGWLTIREFATLAGISEGSTRAAIREGKLAYVRTTVNNQERVFISPVEVLVRHLPALLSTAKCEATIEQLRIKAQVAGVQLDLEELSRSLRALCDAVSARPRPVDQEPPAVESSAPIQRDVVPRQ